MGIPMAYNTGTTNTYTEKTVKRGTVALNPGPTLAPSYNWWNGVDVTSSQYLIYSDTYTTGQATQANARPTAWTTPDLTDASLLALINTLPERIGQTPFTYAPVAVKWLQQSGRYFLIKNDFENIVTDGLITNIDASWPNSYSGTSTWFSLAGNGNISLYNTPTFNSNNGGSISFDGGDDYATTGVNTLPVSLRGNPQFTIGGWFKRSGTWSGGATWGIGTPGNATNINSYNWDVENSIGIDLYGNTTYNTNQTYSDTEWKHVMWTYNGNGFNSNNIIIYINGIAYTGDGLITKRYSGAAPNIGTNGLTLGRVSAAENLYYGKPIIGSFTAYNRVLSPAEIMQNFYAQGYRFGYSADTIVTSGLTLSLDAANGLSYPASGSTWYDIKESGGNNGTLTNGAVFSATTGGVIRFDGTNDIINFPSSYNATTAGLNNYHSVEMWVYPYVVTRGDDGLFKSLNGGGGTGRHLHYIIRNSRFHLGWYSIDTTGNQILTNNTWYQVVFMFDTDDRQKIYVNGALDATGVVLSNNPNLIDGKFYNGGTGPIWLGWYSSYFQGLMPIVRVYNRALSASEVLQNYNAQKGRFGL